MENGLRRRLQMARRGGKKLIWSRYSPVRNEARVALWLQFFPIEARRSRVSAVGLTLLL